MAVITKGGCHQPVLLSMIFCSLQTSADPVFLVLPFWISSPTLALFKSTSLPTLKQKNPVPAGNCSDIIFKLSDWEKNTIELILSLAGIS